MLSLLRDNIDEEIVKKYPIKSIIRHNSDVIIYVSETSDERIPIVVKIGFSFQKMLEIKTELKFYHTIPNNDNIIPLVSGCVDKNYVTTYKADGDLFEYFHLDSKIHHKNDHIIFRIMIQVVKAIIFIHKHNFVHGDLDPENIFYVEDDKNDDLCPHVYIGDFGMCFQKNIYSSPRGKPLWRSNDDPMTQKSDMYSIGQMFKYFAYKRNKMLRKNSKYNRDYINIIQKLTHKEPDKRMTATALLTYLLNIYNE